MQQSSYYPEQQKDHGIARRMETDTWQEALMSEPSSVSMEECNSEVLSMEGNLEAALARNAELETHIAELNERLAQQPGPVYKCGYLYKHRPWARLFEKPWELRFFSLAGNVLSFWKSEAVASHHPRGTYSVDDTLVIIEGMKRGKWFIFRIDDSSGGTLLRLSTRNEADGRLWVSLLGSIGCTVLSEEEKSISEGDRGSGITLDAKDCSDRGQTSGEDTGTSSLRQRHVESLSGEVVGPPPPFKEGQDRKEPDPSTRYTLRASTPAHRRSKESPLSSVAIFSQSHAGLFNLCVVLLLAVNSRLILENLMKYGFLMRATFWLSSHSLKDWPLLMCGLTLAIFPILALLVEKLKVHTQISEKVVGLLHTAIVTVEFLYPAYVINKVQSGPLGGFILIFIVVILWMKLISYAHTNYDIRRVMDSGQRQPDSATDAPHVRYPDNLTVLNMLYFLVAPTLCYQLGYPRSRYVRKGWVLRQLIKLAFFVGLMLFIIEQYINPTIKNSVHPLRGHSLYSIERVLKLSIPTVYVWLCMFYCFFHLWLNIVAEVIGFGDREFYKDWWNAKTIEEYWRLWNMPVHKWMVRHVYFPCLRLGLSKPVAVFLVFTLSAVFHEVVVGIPCHMVRMWAFLGIIFQVPLVVLTNYLYERFKKPMVGNMLFWFLFCIVGQPICILLYYHDVQVNLQQQQQQQQQLQVWA